MAKMRLLEPRGGPHSSGHNVSKAVSVRGTCAGIMVQSLVRDIRDMIKIGSVFGVMRIV
ncbi:MAG: hypothetical protein IRD3MM_02250 [Candidatus Midichloria mitochondrii]